MHGTPALVPMSQRAWLQLRNIIFQRIGEGKENGLSVSRPVTSWHAPEPRDAPVVNALLRGGTGTTKQVYTGSLPDARNNLCLTSNRGCRLWLFTIMLPFVYLFFNRFFSLNGKKRSFGAFSPLPIKCK